MTVAGAGDVAGRSLHGPGAIVVPAQVGQDAGRAVAALYYAHYNSLVRLAVLLTGDVTAAERAVQDAFVALHHSPRLLRDSDQAVLYLRRSVLSRSRGGRLRPRRAAVPATAETTGDASVLAALRALPPRQREIVVLQYYGDLTDAAAAAVLGTSAAVVRELSGRAMAALRDALESAA